MTAFIERLIEETDAEMLRLRRFRAALTGEDLEPARPGPSRPRQRIALVPAPARARRSGRRREQALRLVKGHPEGISVRELAEAMGIQPNYLYRLLPEMEREGLIRKWDGVYVPRAALMNRAQIAAARSYLEVERGRRQLEEAGDASR